MAQNGFSFALEVLESEKKNNEQFAHVWRRAVQRLKARCSLNENTLVDNAIRQSQCCTCKAA